MKNSPKLVDRVVFEKWWDASVRAAQKAKRMGTYELYEDMMKKRGAR